MAAARATLSANARRVATRARFVPTAVAWALRYTQVKQLLVERNSQRSIVRVAGAARITVVKLMKKAADRKPAPTPPLRPKKTQHQQWKALELNEMWAFVSQRHLKGCLWLSVERTRRHIVAWVLDHCDAATAQRL